MSLSPSLSVCCSACQNNYVSVALPVRIIMSLFLALPVRLIMSLFLALPVRITSCLFLALPVKILLHHFKPVTSHSIRCRLIHCYNVKNQPSIVHQYTCFSTQKNYFSPFHFLTDTYLYSVGTYNGNLLKSLLTVSRVTILSRRPTQENT